MAQQQQNLERQFRAGIRAAQQGDAQRARQLLEGVLREDRNNDLAWIWMAAIVKSDRERRICLEKALQIHPRNAPAREAINSLVGVVGEDAGEIDYQRIAAAAKTKPPAASRGTSRPAPRSGEGATQTGGGRQQQVILLSVVAVVLLLGFGASFVLPSILASPTATPLPTLVPEVTDDLTPRTPTRAATIGGVVVTLEAGTAFPTNTPTETSTPTVTLTPTATLPPLANYTLYFVAALEGQTDFALYQSQTDGSGQQRLLTEILKADIALDESRLLFTRAVGAGDSETAQAPNVQAFLAPSNDPAGAAQTTRLIIGDVLAVNISPDGSQMVYATTEDGDAELIIIDLQTGITRPLTDNTANDSDPHWSPDGSKIVFVSDRESPGQNDVYAIDLTTGVASLLADTAGNSLMPRWSPNGESILFVTERGRNSSVSVASADGSRVRRLSVPGGARLTSPVWTLDGRYVVLVAQHEDAPDQIVFMTPDGDNQRPITLEGLALQQVLVR